MKREIKNYGFNPDIEIKDDEYRFGSLSTEVINPSASWTEFLPIYEPQAEKYETWGCTVWGGQNQIEIYFKKVFGFEPNYNEIFNYVLAKVGPGGANPHTTYETFRKSGLIDHLLIPFPETYEAFRTTSITPELKAEGLKWIAQYDFTHEWITNTTKENIKGLLKFSPIGVGVTAWIEDEGLYIDDGQPNTHWCVAFNALDTPKGIVLEVFDSYDHSIKKLHPNHNISVAKRILVKKKLNPIITEYQQKGFWKKTLLLVRQFLLWK